MIEKTLTRRPTRCLIQIKDAEIYPSADGAARIAVNGYFPSCLIIVTGILGDETAMTTALRGPHHCIGLATSVAETMFRYLQGRCQANGGTLSAAELDAARTHILGSFSNGFGFFETTHQRCMEASAATAHAPFARDAILASLLVACSHKAARPAFPNQLARFGDAWLNQFYGGVAQYIRQSICPTADERLIKAYAEIAAKLGAKLTINDLLKDNGIRRILYECAMPLISAEAPDDLPLKLSDVASEYIAAQRGIPKPDISKVTEQETRNFLNWLPPQLQISLTGMRPTAEAAAR
jgi:hypothetical protein